CLLGVPRAPGSPLFPYTTLFRSDGAELPAAARSALNSLPDAVAEVRRVENLAAPQAMVAPLGRTLQLMERVRSGLPCAGDRIAVKCTGATGDLAVSLETAERRARTAFLAAAGVLVEATAPRELVAVGDTVPVTVNVYNQGKSGVVLNGVSVWAND